MSVHELVIIGGGPAGLSLALHLAHRGLSSGVVVLERARYPRDKICAGMVADRARRALARIGVTIAVPEAPINELSLGLDGAVVRVREARLGASVRRGEFDHALAREARRRGIEIREGARVTAVERAPGGLVVHQKGAGPLKAQAVVGADGAGSVVRRALGLSGGERLARAIEVFTPPAAGDPPVDAIHFDYGDRALRGYVWDFPAPAGLVCRGVYCTDRGGAHALRRRLEAHLKQKGLEPSDFELRQAAQRWFEPAEPISAPRALLIGEAAGIDIVTGEGIPQAIAYGAEAARYLATRLPARRLGFEDWLATVRRSAFGRRMRALHATSAVFFGPRRPEMERLMRVTPAVLRLWVREFAGAPITPAGLAAGVWQAAPQALRRGGILISATQALMGSLLTP